MKKPTYEELEKKLEQSVSEKVDALKQLKECQRTLNDLSVGVVVHASDTSIIVANPAAENILGLTNEQMLGKKSIDPAWYFVHEDMSRMDVAEYPVAMVLSTKTPLHDYVVGIRHPDRDYVTWVIVNAIPIFSNGNDLEKVIINFMDVTSLKRTEKRLKEAEEFFRIFMEYIPSVVFIKDRKSRTLYVNKCFKETFGIGDKYLNKDPIEIFGDSKLTRQMLEDDRQVFESGFVQREELLTVNDGGKRLFKTLKFVIGKKFIGGIAFDITEEMQRTLTLQQSQKMEAIGILAGGIAHDFNNMLGVIMGNAELAIHECADIIQLKDSLEETLKESASVKDFLKELSKVSSNVKDFLEELLIASFRARDVVSQLLNFSSDSGNNRQTVRLKHVISESIKLLRASIPTSVEIKAESLQKEAILADPTQIHQIIINLCTNSAHAMEKNGGVLTIGLSREFLKEEKVFDYGVLKPGEFVQLEIKDTGHGINPEIVKSVFDPYFTTKPIGKGTGMGLSVVHGIVKSHKGAISVESTLGEGTSIKILFPVASDAKKVTKELISEYPPRGTERILLVDDEVPLLKMMTEQLNSLGYEVVEKSDPQEALEFFAQNPNSFDLIITDMAMPHLNGVQLSQGIKEIRPDMLVILYTGFSELINRGNAAEMGIDCYLDKPLTQKVLGDAIRKVLDNAEKGGLW